MKGDTPAPVTIRIENHGTMPIYILDSCYSPGLDGVQIDGISALDAWSTYDCDDALACTTQGLDCFGSPDVAIPAGGSQEVTWDGRLLAPATFTVPQACRPGCNGAPDVPSICRRAALVPAGSHTLSIWYSAVDQGTKQSLDFPFTLPSAKVTVAIP